MTAEKTTAGRIIPGRRRGMGIICMWAPAMRPSTQRSIMAKQSGVDVEVFKAGLNALYNGTLYMGDLENNPSDARRSILVRVNVRTGEVKLVAEPKNMGGYRASITYNGKLYFVAADASPIFWRLIRKITMQRRLYIPVRAQAIRSFRLASVGWLW